MVVPNIAEFANGLDYSSGIRKGRVFHFTYKGAEKGLPAYKQDDHTMKLTYRLPDQLTFSGWAGSCPLQYVQQYRESKSVSEYLKTSSSSFGIGFDQTVDVSMTVPIGEAKVTASTQLRTAGGFGTASGALEYYQQIKAGRSNVIHIAHVSGLWTVSWKKYKARSTSSMPGEDEFSGEFKSALVRLKKWCAKRKPAEKGRLSGTGSKLTMTKCDQEAKDIVAQFGTHYIKEGRFGGESSINFYYNEAAMTTTDILSTERYSRSEFAFLFFGVSTSSSSSESSYSKEHMKSVVQIGSERQRGGNPAVKNTGKWCKSVRSQPALVGYNKVIPLSELVKGDGYGKYASFMAILDKWYCNGGTAFDFDRAKGTVKCNCPKPREKDYELDGRCQPITGKCYSSTGGQVPCIHGKIILGFATSYRRIFWLIEKMHLSTYVQRPDMGYAIMGTLGIESSTFASGRTAVVSLRTSDTLVKPALSFAKVWAGKQSEESLGDIIISVWRPACPEGYTSISDFFQRGARAPPRGIYKDYTLRPCIVNSCLKTCFAKWLWQDEYCPAGVHVHIFSIVGGQSKYGSELGSAGGFFRALRWWYGKPHDHVPVKLTQCLDPKCILEE